MFRRIAFSPFSAVTAVAVTAYATISSLQPPNVTLHILAPFNTSVTVKHYQKGEDVLNSPPDRLTTVASMTRYRGWWGQITHQQADDHPWTISVYATNSSKVLRAYRHAKDGYEAGLNEEPEFLGLDERSYLFARFGQKHFRWGDAVSFLSQFSQDAGLYVPHNGHLTYEVWGVTRDHQYTVVAHVAVSHPELADWGSGVRDARSLDALKKDRDYKRVETCRPDEFEPSLTAFDRLIDSLTIQ